MGILINKFCGELCFFKYSLIIPFASVFVRTWPITEGDPFRLEIPMSEVGWAACSWPPMSLKWLEFLVGMVRMDQWDLGGM